VFRNQFEQELTVRALRKHKVELISFAEPLTKERAETSKIHRHREMNSNPLKLLARPLAP